MKIGSFDNPKPIAPAGGAGVGAATTPAAKPATPVAAPEASAKVALSPAAAVLVNESNAEFDAAKVARIAQAIRDGQFQIDAEAIADKLIANTQELLGGARH